MFGAEEFFRYDPSRSNDKVLSQLQRYRDDELESLRRSGDMQIQAKRETLQNFAKIPESIADSYLQGTEENRRQRQQNMLEEQDARQRELHPLDIESRKSSLERNKFGLSEEQKQSEDAQRQRDWKTAKRAKGLPGEGMTNEEYSYKLGEDAQVAGIQGQKAQQGLAGVQIQNAKEQIKTSQDNRAVQLATAQYKNAYMNNDAESVAALDKKLSNLDPGLVQLAKGEAQAAINSARKLEDINWQGSPQGEKTMAELQSVQKKSQTIAQVKTLIGQYNAAGWETTNANELKENIVALLNRPEMGPEGQHAADLVKTGILGIRPQPSLTNMYTTTKERLDSSLENLERGIEADLKQIETQNQGVRVPMYLNTITNTKASFNQAKGISTRPPAPNMNGTPTPSRPGVGMQNVNIDGPGLQNQKNNLLNQAPNSRFTNQRYRGK